MKLAHIVNPVVAAPSSDLFLAQPVSFETMREARRNALGCVDVDLFATQFPEDRSIVPEDFAMLADLTRSLRDVAPGANARKLPLLREILDRLYEATDADYLIYTNVDIGLQPRFYRAVREIVLTGYDTFSITRRTISGQFTRIDEIPQMLRAEGQRHPGLDCFVYPRKLYPLFRLGETCVGLPPVGKVLWANLLRYGRRPRVFRDLHLTFHIGDDRIWQGGQDEARHANFSTARRVVSALYHGTHDAQRRRRLQPFLDRIVEVQEQLADARPRGESRPRTEEEPHVRTS